MNNIYELVLIPTFNDDAELSKLITPLALAVVYNCNSLEIRPVVPGLLTNNPRLDSTIRDPAITCRCAVGNTFFKISLALTSTPFEISNADARSASPLNFPATL